MGQWEGQIVLGNDLYTSISQLVNRTERALLSLRSLHLATISSPSLLPAMASQKPRAHLPRLAPPLALAPDPVKEAFTKLGLTEEQFKAKQSEMMESLFRKQPPFVPREAPQKAPPKLSSSSFERMVASSSRFSRERSRSVSSSSSSRGPSPAPRTPARKDQSESTPQRPRDQMELIIEERNRVKQDKMRGVLHVVNRRSAVSQLAEQDLCRVNAKKHASQQLRCTILRALNQ